MTLKTNKGVVFQIDRSDYHLVKSYKWNSTRDASGSIRLKASIKGTITPIARLLLNAPKGTVADHISGDTLDNRRSNLRLCTPMQNSWNRKLNKNSSSGFKGVYRKKGSPNNWVFSLRANKKHYRGFGFKNIEDAVKARALVMEKVHGEFARLL